MIPPGFEPRITPCKGVVLTRLDYRIFFIYNNIVIIIIITIKINNENNTDIHSGLKTHSQDQVILPSIFNVININVNIAAKPPISIFNLMFFLLTI